MNGSRSAQLSTWKLQNTWRYCSNSWLTHSVSPSVCRWNTVDREDLTPSFSHISHITFDANWGPLSDITFLGRPVRFHTWLMYNCNVSSAVIVLLHGANITALLRRSTTTSSASYPFDVGRSVMKSMVIISHMSVGISLGFKGTWVLGRDFVDWQTAQPSTYSHTKVDMPGHQYSCDTSSYIFQRPGCPVAR